jgi:hypothetical protein
MATGIHPAAPHHLPPFITAPGQTDWFFNGSAIFLVFIVIALGTLYFRLHALPEHLAHGSDNKLQFQVVGVLALLALFTHNNIFWVAALLLALIRIPDLATPLAAIADSLARMARWGRPAAPAGPAVVVAADEASAARLRLPGADYSQTSGPAASTAAEALGLPVHSDPGSNAPAPESRPHPEIPAEKRIPA